MESNYTAAATSAAVASIQPYCKECNCLITDQFLLQIQNAIYHTDCLKCTDCGVSLRDKCYAREGKIYCKDDFLKQFAKKCNGCDQVLAPDESVRRAHDLLYHIKCFMCHSCQRLFSTGDEFYLTNDRRILCKHDFDTSKMQEIELEHNSKRPRTTINAKQLECLKKAYHDSPKPARHVREQLSIETGLDMRVVQVWFQNRRAKEKRLKRDRVTRFIGGCGDGDSIDELNLGLGLGLGNQWGTDFSPDDDISTPSPSPSSADKHYRPVPAAAPDELYAAQPALSSLPSLPAPSQDGFLPAACIGTLGLAAMNSHVAMATMDKLSTPSSSSCETSPDLLTYFFMQQQQRQHLHQHAFPQSYQPPQPHGCHHSAATSNIDNDFLSARANDERDGSCGSDENCRDDYDDRIVNL